MQLTFSDEQQQLRETIRSFLERKSTEADVRNLMATSHACDVGLWRGLADMGVLGLAVPEEYGGGGYTHVELGIFFEEAGRALLCAPYVSTLALAAETLLRCGDEASKKEFIPEIVSGDLVATVAVAEHSGCYAAPDIRATAVQTNGRWQVSGTKHHVIDGARADLLLVAARTPSGIGLFAVSGDAAGVERTPLETMDQTRKQVQLTLDATPARLIGDEDSWAAIQSALDAAWILVAAEQIGGMARVLEMATGYAKLRVQFGRPIGSFQAVKHSCADMLIATETARSAAYQGLRVLAQGDNAALPMASAVARICCSEGYAQAAGANIQVHGGIGFTWEHPAHLYYKRAVSTRLLFPSPRECVQRLSVLLDL